MAWLADNNVNGLKIVNEMPVLDFFIMLNKKIIETERKINLQRK